MRMTRSRLISVFHLIGGERGASFINQSQGVSRKTNSILDFFDHLIGNCLTSFELNFTNILCNAVHNVGTKNVDPAH